MTNFKEITNVNFELNEAHMTGLKKNQQYGGYVVPVVLDTDTVEKINELVEEHNTKSPLYGDLIYLKVKTLSDKQRSELLNKGKHNVMVHFKATGVYTKDDISYLVFKVTRLRMLFKVAASPPPED